MNGYGTLQEESETAYDGPIASDMAALETWTIN